MSSIQPTWKSSLGQPPSWGLGKCKWWSATLCGATGSRWEWNPLWAAAEASCACQEDQREQRGACSPGLGAAQSKNTTERVQFTGGKQVKENHTTEKSSRGNFSDWKDIPQFELLLRTVLYHRTWPSGHKSCLQKKVSADTVRAVELQTVGKKHGKV